MILDIHVEPYEVDSMREYAVDFPEGKFPLFQIGKGSYINGAKIETSLNFHVADGCHNLQIGKYCALAEDITFLMDLMHDYRYVSMGAVAEFRDAPKMPARINKSRVRRKGQVLIGNDVWIGHGATIMGGVTVHSGGVIGAGSVVTKDVPPYAVVAGNPAKVVKYRFEPEEIRELLEIKWWHWPSELLRSRYEQMLLPIPDFIGCFRKEAEQKKKEALAHSNPVNKNVSGKVYACMADMGSSFPVCPKIIKEFCETYHEMDGQLVIYIEDTGHKESDMAGVLEALSPYGEMDCSIQLIDGEKVLFDDVIRFSDVYITNRGAANLAAVEQAYLFHKDVVSGVDIPVRLS